MACFEKNVAQFGEFSFKNTRFNFFSHLLNIKRQQMWYDVKVQ